MGACVARCWGNFEQETAMSAHHTDYAAMGLPTGLGENAFTDTRISSVFASPEALKAAKRAAVNPH